MMNAETNDTAATVAALGATVAPEKAASKKPTIRKQGAPKGQKKARGAEDCGGIGGFYELLDALGDPTHEQHEELQDWVGDDYDPDTFSIEDVNQMLMPLRRRRDKISRGWSPAR